MDYKEENLTRSLLNIVGNLLYTIDSKRIQEKEYLALRYLTLDNVSFVSMEPELLESIIKNEINKFLEDK